MPLFAHVNDRIFTDPRVTIHEADGRQFMGRAPREYGVVTLEPPPPRAAGAASLYTAEIYARARQSMRPGGVIAQWLPLHGLSETELLLLARTFGASFAHAAIFILNADEAALIGSPTELVLDVSKLRARLAVPGVRESLASIDITAGDEGDDRLLAEIAALGPVHGAAFTALVGPGPIVTDDRPLAESFAVLLAQRSFERAGEPDGRNAFFRRVLASPWAPLPVRGTLPAGYRAASARLRAEMTAVLQRR